MSDDPLKCGPTPSYALFMTTPLLTYFLPLRYTTLMIIEILYLAFYKKEFRTNPPHIHSRNYKCPIPYHSLYHNQQVYLKQDDKLLPHEDENDESHALSVSDLNLQASVNSVATYLSSRYIFTNRDCDKWILPMVSGQCPVKFHHSPRVHELFQSAAQLLSHVILDFCALQISHNKLLLDMHCVNSRFSNLKLPSANSLALLAQPQSRNILNTQAWFYQHCQRNSDLGIS